MSGRVPQLAGAEALMDLLLDGEAYLAKLQELQQTRDEAAANVERLVGAQEVDSLRIKAASDRQMAAETLAMAREEAQHLREGATRDRRAREEHERCTREEMVERERLCKSQLQEAQQALDAARALTTRAEAAMQHAEEVAAQAKRDIAAADTARRTYEDKLKQFRALVG